MLIESLLVANRGEIARRVMRTARAMGIRTVAVYSDADRHSPHVAEADRAVALPGSDPAGTYLDAERLVAAALTGGADAVHPGYGFLSERADFARAVTAAGLTWVGPPADAIAIMGDKVAAKEAMAAAGVPVLPTWAPGDPEVTYPVLVKAAAGGGGKGMRIVTAPADLAEAVAAARREAATAFGDDRVFLERYVSSARHIEIQVLADGHGHTIHCFERECSIQRRHQKIVEEAPSPALDPAGRDRMGAAAVAAARAVDYRSAGTVEFVVEPDGRFWFLEVNTRLQVEHPVTEAVTGLDLVREQLLVAQGLPLSVDQAGVRLDGHAVEVRLYAEDPAAGFLPATGELVDWQPAAEPAVRWDSGVEAGSVIGVRYDPMVAKVVAHAPTRPEAAQRLALALERSRIRGVTTNRDYLVAVLRSPAFRAGETTTDFVERSGVRPARTVDPAELEEAAAAVALARRHPRRAAAHLASVPAGWRNTVMPAERLGLDGPTGPIDVAYRTQRDATVELEISMDGTAGAAPDGTGRSVTVRAGAVTVEADGPGWAVAFDAGGRRVRRHVLLAGRAWAQGPDGDVVFDLRPRFPAKAAEVPEGGLLAPMPGRVLAVGVAAGDRVTAGQLLIVVEAMKMEHRVTAPHDGVVTEVRAEVADQVAGGDLLVVLDGAQEEGSGG